MEMNLTPWILGKTWNFAPKILDFLIVFLILKIVNLIIIVDDDNWIDLLLENWWFIRMTAGWVLPSLFGSAVLGRPFGRSPDHRTRMVALRFAQCQRRMVAQSGPIPWVGMTAKGTTWWRSQPVKSYNWLVGQQIWSTTKTGEIWNGYCLVVYWQEKFRSPIWRWYSY